MEARSLGRELHEDGDGAVRLRPRRGEEAVGDLPLHHHAPQLDRREPVERLGDQGRRDLVRQVRDELRRRRIQRVEVEGERVPEVQLHIGPALESFSKRLREGAVDLDRVHGCDPVGQVGRQHAEAWADLEDDVGRRESGEPPDHAEEVHVDEKMLAEVPLRNDGHASENAVAAFASSLAESSATSTARSSASAATVCTTFAGSFGLPRSG